MRIAGATQLRICRARFTMGQLFTMGLYLPALCLLCMRQVTGLSAAAAHPCITWSFIQPCYVPGTAALGTGTRYKQHRLRPSLRELPLEQQVQRQMGCWCSGMRFMAGKGRGRDSTKKWHVTQCQGVKAFWNVRPRWSQVTAAEEGVWQGKEIVPSRQNSVSEA